MTERNLNTPMQFAPTSPSLLGELLKEIPVLQYGTTEVETSKKSLVVKELV